MAACMYVGGASIGGDEYDKIDVRLMGFVRGGVFAAKAFAWLSRATEKSTSSK